MEICAVKDNAIEAYGQPIFVQHTNQAIRSFKDELNREGSAIGAHPEDYELFHIGRYNEHTGEIESFKPHRLGRGVEFIKTLPDHLKNLYPE